MSMLELNVSYWIDANGKPTIFRLKDHFGQWVIINCFQHWCEGCHIDSLPDLKIIAETFVDNEQVEVICIQTVFEGFDINTQARVRETQLRYELPIIMGHDAGDSHGQVFPSTMRQFKTGGTPWIIVINPEGEIVFNDFRINVISLLELLNKK